MLNTKKAVLAACGVLLAVGVGVAGNSGAQTDASQDGSLVKVGETHWAQFFLNRASIKSYRKGYLAEIRGVRTPHRPFRTRTGGDAMVAGFLMKIEVKCQSKKAAVHQYVHLGPNGHPVDVDSEMPREFQDIPVGEWSWNAAKVICGPRFN